MTQVETENKEVACLVVPAELTVVRPCLCHQISKQGTNATDAKKQLVLWGTHAPGSLLPSRVCPSCCESADRNTALLYTS